MKSLQQNERKADTSASGLNQIVKSYCVPVSRLVDNGHLSKPKRKSSENTLREDSSRILDLDLISKDVGLSRYWNSQCQELQYDLWLPHESNYTVEKLSWWKKDFLPKTSMLPHSLVFSLPSATPKVESGMQTATKKVRVYPSEPQKVDRQIDYSRRAYNLCVACYRKWKKGDTPVNFTQLRREVREQVQGEASTEGKVVSSSLDEACQEAKRANQSVIRKRVKGQKSELAFRKKSTTKQGFIYQKVSSLGLPKVLGGIHLTESIPPETIGYSARLTREYGRYYLLTKRFIPTVAAKSQGNAVGVDPGVRTFATTFATDCVTKLGEDFQKEKLRPLGIKLDRLYSKRKKLFNRWSSLGDQLRNDLLRCYQKRINRLKARRQDLIVDLHRRVCYYLVTTYDFILLPAFRVKQMTSKVKRKIGSKVVRGMMDLCHYKFHLMLAWMCKKYGKTLIVVNEAYTSKTQSWSGKLSEVGIATTISDGSLVVDRDINGARGIFLRAATR